MDLTQKKLTKSEWEFLEQPLNKNETSILKLILNGRTDINTKFNTSKSLLSFIKISNNLEAFHYYCYQKYFTKLITNVEKKYGVRFIPPLKKKKSLEMKKKDIIRIKNIDKKIDKIKDDLYEYVLLDNVTRFLKTKDIRYYYTLVHLLGNNIEFTNEYVLLFVDNILKQFKNDTIVQAAITNAHEVIERNDELLKYSNVELYEHQKQLFSICNNNKEAALTLYQAPTGTGKTLSPIGLKKRVVFVCAAKHIGLQLAKSCISMEIPIAIAFGCKDVSDIRLHYFAVTDFVKNRRTGGIFRVDNSVGDKVEIIISDIQSYLYSMRYMMAFNKKEDLLWYWDEPTITLDYVNHEFHELLKQNWNENEIPNIVLSSATLPSQEDIFPMIRNYKSRFPSGSIQNVVSYECRKTIPIINSNGFTVMPHYTFTNMKDIKKSVKHLENNKTIMRHFDIEEISKFIKYIHEKDIVKERFKYNNYFQDINEVNIISIKIYYLKLLSKLKSDQYDLVHKYLLENRKQKYKSTIKITTDDSHTLTDGPTILITNNVEKIAKFYLKISKIPESELTNVLKVIVENSIYSDQLDEIIAVEKERIDKQQMSKEKSEREAASGGREEQELEFYKQRLAEASSRIQAVHLAKKFIPNSDTHIKRFGKTPSSRIFTSDIDDTAVENIMLLEIPDVWKILLLMGIGVFLKHESVRYMEIMKKLAEEQKLYLIIASSDYIYGTNYQFCHGYLTKDLTENMTQEKMLQAFGRVGRRDLQKDYSIRIRDDRLIEKLFTIETDKIEVKNMNKLFG
jgi:hypothetical protein|uniref:Uncharacterized protein n=1 Tax=viral metagenome TaxID=1070528 RepID=A0A6C0INN3_9ZZZZ